jgi:hypothetical protein
MLILQENSVGGEIMDWKELKTLSYGDDDDDSDDSDTGDSSSDEDDDTD